MPPSTSSALPFNCPSIGATTSLPYVKFDPSGMVSAPDNSLFVDVFAGSVNAENEMSYTDANQKNAAKFDSVVLARFTGRAKYVDPYSG